MTAHKQFIRTGLTLLACAALAGAFAAPAPAAPAAPAEAAPAEATSAPGLATFEAMGPAAELGDEALRALLAPLAVRSTSGSFIERRSVPGFPKPMVTEGFFRLAGDVLRWEAARPFPSLMTVSPEGVVIEAAGERQTLSAAEVPAAGRIAELLTGVLSGRVEALREFFELRAREAGGTVALAARPRAQALAGVVKEMRARGSAARGVEAIELEVPDGGLTAIELRAERIER